MSLANSNSGLNLTFKGKTPDSDEADSVSGCYRINGSSSEIK
jgi:hypothetical protein